MKLNTVLSYLFCTMPLYVGSMEVKPKVKRQKADKRNYVCVEACNFELVWIPVDSLPTLVFYQAILWLESQNKYVSNREAWKFLSVEGAFLG